LGTNFNEWKETAQGSFLKYTAHEFLKNLKETGDSARYEVNAANKKHEIWQRDSLSVEIYTREVAKKKWSTFILIRLTASGI
jgi:hypothetical protein